MGFVSLDINNAFLNGTNDITVYMIQPPGFEVSDKSLVCRLNKAIYGLKQDPGQWFNNLKTTLPAWFLVQQVRSFFIYLTAKFSNCPHTGLC